MPIQQRYIAACLEEVEKKLITAFSSIYMQFTVYLCRLR